MSVGREIIKLLDRINRLHNRIRLNPKYTKSNELHRDMEEWINDVAIFNCKYLKEYPLYQRINEIIQRRNEDTIIDLQACLKSILKDRNFLAGDVKNMKEYEIFFRVMLDYADMEYDYPRVKFYGMESGDKELINKLQSEGLITNIVLKADINYVEFNITDKGVHYFDEYKPKILSTTKGNSHSMCDLFISHANKDKLDYVEQLKASLSRLGISIFYDKDSLEWGDKWKQRILDGVAKAEFAIIVISKNFFDREWTERELKELLNRQNDSGQKIILPLIHNITIEQLANKYPELADIQAISTSDYSCDVITNLFAKQLIKRIKEQRA